jgi:DHA1 family bicyclomycin/chloramphenicol resistance-like MFS transporter
MNGWVKSQAPARPPFREFIALMALLTSLVALSIDTLLPALPAIGQSLGVQDANQNQWVITVLFLGMAVGQLFFGPFADSVGRKPAVFLGLALFMIGCLLSVMATVFWVLLVGRILQGLGASGPRIMTLTLVRDQYEGRAMARVMSFVTTVFILVPVVAPLAGQLIMEWAGWRSIFGFYLALAVIAAIWFALRQPETLLPTQRRLFSWRDLGEGIRAMTTNRAVVGYTLIMGMVFGLFIGYLSSAQQIFQNQYQVGRRFPIFFAILALALGAASLVNARLVMRLGMRVLSRWALNGICVLSLVFLGGLWATRGGAPLWSLMAFLLITFFGVGLLFGNLNALAMEPMGDRAGMGASVVGSVSTLISLLVGSWIGQSYNGTLFPLVGGFVILSGLGRGLLFWAESTLPSTDIPGVIFDGKREV